MALCTIRIYDSVGGSVVDQIDLDWVRWQNGSPEKTQAAIAQPLESMGVDNSRLRHNRKDYKPFKATGCQYLATYPNAVSAADNLREYDGYIVTIEYTADGVTYTEGMFYYMTDAIFSPQREDSVGGVLGAKGTVYFSATLKATGVTL